MMTNTLRRRRDRAGLSLRQLAAEARVCHSYLSQIERGERWPSSKVLKSIHTALDRHIDQVAEAAEAKAEIHAAAEMLAPYLGRVPETCADADDDADLCVLLYPADITALLARIGLEDVRPGFESLSGPFIYEERGRAL